MAMRRIPGGKFYSFSFSFSKKKKKKKIFQIDE